MSQDYFVHQLAIVESDVSIGAGTKIWHWSQIRSGAKVGSECIIAKSVFIDSKVIVGNRVKIQNNASIYMGVTIEDGVFVGPHVCFTNDLNPRAISSDGELKSSSDWKLSSTIVNYGASIGANSTILADVTLGKWSLIGAGSVVTKNIPPHALAFGNPAQIKGIVSPSGEIIAKKYMPGTYQDSQGYKFEILKEWCT